jgi:hypothetical protein
MYLLIRTCIFRNFFLRNLKRKLELWKLIFLFEVISTKSKNFHLYYENIRFYIANHLANMKATLLWLFKIYYFQRSNFHNLPLSLDYYKFITIYKNWMYDDIK